MATPRQNADMILSLFSGAPTDIRSGFGLRDDMATDGLSFTIPGAVLRATVRRD
jgi:hypothetical protein